MDGARFDTWVRVLATGIPRRQALRGLAAGLAAAVGLLGRGAAAAPCRRGAERCGGDLGSGPCCDGVCCGRTCCPPETVGCTQIQTGRGVVLLGCLCPEGTVEQEGHCVAPQICAGPGERCGSHRPCCPEAGVCAHGQCCIPTTCAAEGVQCGKILDGCGGTIECGECAWECDACIEGMCVPGNDGGACGPGGVCQNGNCTLVCPSEITCVPSEGGGCSCTGGAPCVLFDAGPACVCVPTPEGEVACVVPLSVDCSAPCTTSADCGNDRVCVAGCNCCVYRCA